VDVAAIIKDQQKTPEKDCHYVTIGSPLFQYNFLRHHDQLINVPNAGAQAFLMDYTWGELGMGLWDAFLYPHSVYKRDL
jgi:hypothetical protein